VCFTKTELISALLHCLENLQHRSSHRMFDIALRAWKDRIFDPLCSAVPKPVTPLHLTVTAFVCGVASCIAVAKGEPRPAVLLWIANRCFDCLDGAVARRRGQASELGAFLDLLGVMILDFHWSRVNQADRLQDFIIYSAIPICCALGYPAPDPRSSLRLWLAVSLSEATFHVNNFVLFFVAAVAEKRKAADGKDDDKSQGLGKGSAELTSLMMRPALVEGAESGLIFTLMLAVPQLTGSLCWVLVVGVSIGILQRVTWTVSALRKIQHRC